LPTPLAQATRLVASIEAAQRTGQGDIRSNEVVEKLLVIARMWIAELRRQSEQAQSPAADVTFRYTYPYHHGGR
jgi:hypothetical protein